MTGAPNFRRACFFKGVHTMIRFATAADLDGIEAIYDAILTQ